MDDAKDVTLSLSRDEALVLFEFLSRFSDDNNLRIDHLAEARVLWDLCCMLEATLDEPLREDYLERLHRAREVVCDPNGEQAG